jgi:hypothetical protein
MAAFQSDYAFAPDAGDMEDLATHSCVVKTAARPRKRARGGIYLNVAKRLSGPLPAHVPIPLLIPLVLAN